MKRWISLAVFVVLVFIVASVSSRYMPGPWYASLAKPSWTPPNWLFAPVWTVLYLMIAIAGWLVWKKGQTSAALPLWGAQLVLNGAWSWIMFGLHRIDLALIEVAFLWLSIASFIVVTWRDNRNAALLFLPYLAWVSFASALNLAIWRLNS